MAAPSLDLQQRSGEEHQFILNPTTSATPVPYFEQTQEVMTA